MKIDNSIKTVGAMQAGEARQRATRDVNADTTADSSAKVDLSPRSSQLQKLQTSIQNAPAVDRSKIEQIKQAISNGEFKINPEKIADGLIRDVSRMLSERTA